MNEHVPIENNRNIAIDYLRAFLTVLVVLHHSLLAYTTHGYGALIVDPAKWVGFDVITGFLDTRWPFGNLY